MSLSVESLATLIKSASTLSEVKTLLRLVNIEVLSKKGSDTYLISYDKGEKEALSPKPLEVGAKYLANILAKEDKLLLNELAKLPKIALIEASHHFSAKDILTLLQTPNAAQKLQNSVMELMAQSHSKEEFSALSQMLLSLNQGVITLPFVYEERFELFQMRKKRHTKKEKLSVEFYATLTRLGIIEGEVTLLDDTIYLTLHVAFEHVKEILLHALKELNILHVTIDVKDDIIALFETSERNILDTTI